MDVRAGCDTCDFAVPEWRVVRTFREMQYPAVRMLLCTGDIQHTAPMPRVRSEGITSTDLRCEECGAAMVLIDVITVDRAPTLSSLAYDRGAPLYTTAKLHPPVLLSAASGGVGEAATPAGEGAG